MIPGGASTAPIVVARVAGFAVATPGAGDAVSSIFSSCSILEVAKFFLPRMLFARIEGLSVVSCHRRAQLARPIVGDNGIS